VFFTAVAYEQTIVQQSEYSAGFTKAEDLREFINPMIVQLRSESRYSALALEFPSLFFHLLNCDSRRLHRTTAP